MNLKSQELGARIATCMIRDRFALKRALSLKRFASVQAKIERSHHLALERENALPSVNYPEALPISKCLSDIEEAIARNQVVVIAGETGSGKTTQIPKLCLAMGLGIYGAIGHTQPRVVATPNCFSACCIRT